MVFLHTAWLAKPIPEARAKQNILNELSQGIGARGLKKVPEGKTGTLQAANFYLPICVNPAPTLSIFGFFLSFICLDELLVYEKAGGCGLFLLSTELKGY